MSVFDYQFCRFKQFRDLQRKIVEILNKWPEGYEEQMMKLFVVHINEKFNTSAYIIINTGPKGHNMWALKIRNKNDHSTNH